MHSSSGAKTCMKINSVDPTSTKPPERSGKTIGNNSQDKESSEDFSTISSIPSKEEKKKKESAAYMPKTPYPQRLKAENKNKTPKKEPKEEKGATNDSMKFQQIQKEKGKLGFPSTIYKLCKEAGVPLREFRRTKKIPVEKPITAGRIESTRLPRNLQHQPQDNEDEDQPMPQAEEGHEEGHGEEQGEEHDYQHHQPEFQHEPQFQQPPLYEVPTYTDQHEKDLHSIEEQLQNMMWYQQQCLENINKSQVEYMA
ncbi:hypothetical protein PIB30_058938 [Stylosanthes scabra]|uniref:Uncharacterized protein n=1 Tax=Stylosanthes scabra TaxID=79078 RepID=A0ABU6WIE3_9FABA|nr:hypothetical protein [Stylosanthes scabra]